MRQLFRKKKSERNSNIELLRIIAIIGVILSHFNVHSGFREVMNSQFNINVLLSNIFSIGCVANSIFIIITGYFLINKSVKYRKILSLIIEMYVYSILIYIVTMMLMPDKAKSIDMKQILLPFPFGNWFCVYYIALYIFAPIINKVYKKFLSISAISDFLLLLLSALIVMIIGWFSNSTSINNALSFIVFYMTGAYIKNYEKLISKKINSKKFLLLAILLWVIIACSSYSLTCIFGNTKYVWWGIKLLGRNTSIFVLLLGVALFILFKEKNIENNTTINIIASSTLGIYLIHENQIIRDIIWKRVLPINIYTMNPIVFVILCVVKVFAVFSICLVIDLARQKITDFIKRYKRNYDTK